MSGECQRGYFNNGGELIDRPYSVLYMEQSVKLEPMYIYFVDMSKVKDGINRIEDVSYEW